ncbi:MAG: hypothetical protein QOG51_1290 [Verrucomicrobiota bacterium]
MPPGPANVRARGRKKSRKVRAWRGVLRSKGKGFDPNAPPLANLGPDMRVPRPSTTRYPIDMAAFAKLKGASATAKKLLKRESVITPDKPGKAQRAAGRERMAAKPGPAAHVATLEPALNFAGISATGLIPPDCTLAAGPDHLLASVNPSIAVFSRLGGAPLLQRTLKEWFANVVQDAFVFDPKALYDQHAGRWVLLAVAAAKDPDRSWFLLSVSTSSSPLDPWHNYALDATQDGGVQTNNWVDYPAVGADAHALYLTGNMFRFGGGFEYAKVRIVPKEGPYSGGTITFTDLVRLKNGDGSMAFTVQPCHIFGAPQVQYLVNTIYPEENAPENKLSLWSITDPLAESPTISLQTIEVSPYGLPPDSIQQGEPNPLDTGDARILNAVFRGGSIWCAFATQHNWEEETNVAAIHWVQIEAASGVLIQQGIYGAKSSYYSYPALMPNNNGDLIMVFSRCSATEFASIGFTGRKAADDLGTLRNSSILQPGAAGYLNLDDQGRNRWGDYAGIAADPANPASVWFFSLFAVPGGWSTWIGSAS